MKTNKKLILKLCLIGATLSFISIPTVAILTSCSSKPAPKPAPKPIPKVTFTTTLIYNKDAINDPAGDKGAYIVPLADKTKIANCDELTIAGPTVKTVGQNLIFQAPNWLQQDATGKKVDTYKRITKINLNFGAISSIWNTLKDVGGPGALFIPSGVSQMIVKTKKIDWLFINGSGTKAKLKIDLKQALSIGTFAVNGSPNYCGTDTTLNTNIDRILVIGGTFKTWNVSKNLQLEHLALIKNTNLQILNLTKNINMANFQATDDPALKTLDFINCALVNDIDLNNSTSLNSIILPLKDTSPNPTLDISGCSSLKTIKNINKIQTVGKLHITYNENSVFDRNTVTNTNIKWEPA